jgi:cytoskeletal protein CcmA (bactofilin family)
MDDHSFDLNSQSEPEQNDGGSGGIAQSADPERQLYVGRGIKLEGSLSDCEVCNVLGTFKGQINAKTLAIASTGRVEGDLTVETAMIMGEFDGTLNVKGGLQLRNGAKVSGKIAYEEIEIERGAQLSGEIGMGESGAATTKPPAARAPAPAPAPTPAPQKQPAVAATAPTEAKPASPAAR